MLALSHLSRSLFPNARLTCCVAFPWRVSLMSYLHLSTVMFVACLTVVGVAATGSDWQRWSNPNQFIVNNCRLLQAADMNDDGLTDLICVDNDEGNPQWSSAYVQYNQQATITVRSFAEPDGNQ